MYSLFAQILEKFYLGLKCFLIGGDTLRVVDLRSDTVTLPTEEMLEAIKNAKLGDDSRGKEDPTVNRLEEMAAEKMGKKSALLVTSGTQANLVSLLSQTERGDAVILEAQSHIYLNELGGMAAIGGLMARPIKGKYGVLDPKDVEEALKIKGSLTPKTALICIENTHNRAGGTVWTPKQIKDISDIAKAHNIPLYLDGSRIFNAAVALNVDVKELTKYVDSLMFCLSKGLSCPIGSLVVGSEEFIKKAKKIRRMLGGGMRQAGIIAAPGIIALEKMIDRLKEDHDNARILAKALTKIDGISLDLKAVQTNIVFIDVSGLGVNSSRFAEKVAEQGVKVMPIGDTLVRMVTHRGIEREDIEYAIGVIENAVYTLRSKDFTCAMY